MSSAIEEMCRLDKTVQTPHIACTKKDDKYYYCLDLPGVKKNDVEVSIEDKSLLVNWVRSNTSHSKQISLYNSVSDLDLDSCEAALEDGVLTISFQVFKEKPKKKIVVK
jgi:HSP20 family molecular chaperone IbpA